MVLLLKMTPIDLANIIYPVFKLSSKPNVDEGVIFYYSETERNGVVKSKLSLVDDQSAKGDTLAARRLSLISDGIPLYPLKNAIFFLGDLIKLSGPQVYFIDSNGRLFNYKKTSTAKLKFYKINRIIPITTGGAIIEVEKIPQRFKVLQLPSEDSRCAGILHSGMSTILYGVYNYIPEDTVRRI